MMLLKTLCCVSLTHQYRVEFFLKNSKQLGFHPYSKLDKKINLQIIDQYLQSHASQGFWKEVRLNQISEFFNRNNYFLGNFIDLLKAFEAVNHQMLLKKITLLWHQIQNLKQFLSYLSNRKQCMEHYNRNNKTDFSDITYGVPQGSILGPLIFIIFTNNLHCASNKLELIVFADDTAYSFQTET